MRIPMTKFIRGALVAMTAAQSPTNEGIGGMRSSKARLRGSRCLVVAGLALIATGASNASAAGLAESAERYRSYMIEDISHALAGARMLRERITTNDLNGAKQTWIDARVGWERSEVFTSGFAPDLDDAIDAWPDASTGFHAIEARLFGAEMSGAEAQTDGLVLHLAELDAKIHSIELTPQGLLNGIARLAYEVGEGKVDGGESRFSGTSLNDMRNNADGIDLAYRTIFASALAASDPKIAATAQNEIEELKSVLNAPNLKSVDPDRLRVVSEELVVTLQSAAPKVGLAKPTIEESSPH
jgi:iron uptake system component EfeO